MEDPHQHHGMEDSHQPHGGHNHHVMHSEESPGQVVDSVVQEHEVNHPSPAHGQHQGMMMYFHGGYNETILFYGWTISNVEGLIGSMVGIFVMGILYEALKFYRERHMRQSYSAVPFNETSSGSTSVNTEVSEASLHPSRERPQVLRTLQTEIFSRHHFLQTVLHVVQVVLSYFLMLIFMTYNSWLCAAVAAGLTVGYFLFGWKKPVVLVGDHCH